MYTSEFMREFIARSQEDGKPGRVVLLQERRKALRPIWDQVAVDKGLLAEFEKLNAGQPQAVRALNIQEKMKGGTGRTHMMDPDERVPVQKQTLH